MTDIRYLKDEHVHMLMLSGHAGYAQEGADIVCAGISAVTYTLMGYLENLKAEGAQVISRQDSGDVTIVCLRHQNADTAFEMAMIGYMQIAKKYPDNLTIHISASGGDSREQTVNDSRERP